MSEKQKMSIKSADFVKQLPVLSQNFADIVLLHSTHYSQNYQLIIGLGAKEKVFLHDNNKNPKDFFETLQQDFWMGFLSYDIKNIFEKSNARNGNSY